MPSMQYFWHSFRCLRKVPPELYGRYDGWPGLGWDFSSTRQHLCHRHAGSSPEEVFSVFENPLVEGSEIILSQIYLRLFCWMTNCLSQVSPEDIGFWCFLIAFIFVVLSLVRSQLISLFTIYPLVARLPIALSRPLSFSPSMPGLEGGHNWGLPTHHCNPVLPIKYGPKLMIF